MSRPKINTDSWHFKLLTKSCTPNYVIRQTRTKWHYWRMVTSKLFWMYTVMPLAILFGMLYIGTMLRAGNDITFHYMLNASWIELLRCFGVGIGATIIGCIMGLVFMFTAAWLFDWIDKRKAAKKIPLEKVPTFYSKKTGESKDAGF